jgi:plasmid stability protein
MVLTLTDVPKELDDAIRSRALAQGKSVEQVVLDAIRAGLAITALPVKRDLSEFAGSWVSDPEVEAALKDQDRIDPEMWKHSL